MNYIVFDLEFNQNISSIADQDIKASYYPFEIIQIGAVKLDENFNTVAHFNRYVKPTIYSSILPFITRLTGIRDDMLIKERTFPYVCRDFLDFIGYDGVFCVWGMSDMKELFKNTAYHKLDTKILPTKFINIQSYATLHFDVPNNQSMKLQTVVELLEIPSSAEFHDALNDAYYTSEIFKKLYSPSIEIKEYDPSYARPRIRQPKRIIDKEGLIKQFEKMYQREMTVEEKEIILLSYKMGKTNQFLK